MRSWDAHDSIVFSFVLSSYCFRSWLDLFSPRCLENRIIEGRSKTGSWFYFAIFSLNGRNLCSSNLILHKWLTPVCCIWNIKFQNLHNTIQTVFVRVLWIHFTFNSKITYRVFTGSVDKTVLMFYFCFHFQKIYILGELHQIKPKLGQKQKTVIVRKIEMCFS